MDEKTAQGQAPENPRQRSARTTPSLAPMPARSPPPFCSARGVIPGKGGTKHAGDPLLCSSVFMCFVFGGGFAKGGGVGLCDVQEQGVAGAWG